MTLNSDHQATNPDQQHPAQNDPEVVDIDQQALDEAIAAAEAEKAASEAASDAPADGTGQAPTGQPQQDQPQPSQPAGGDAAMIPKPRFDEVLGRASKAEQDAAYWRGLAEGRAPLPPKGDQPGTQKPPAQPTAQERLTAIHTEQDTLAKKFDDGEITYSDMLKQQRALNDRKQGIREEVLTAKLAPKQTTTDELDDIRLHERTLELEKSPAIQAFNQVATKLDWNYIENTARDNLLGRGVTPGKGKVAALQVREEMAALIEGVGIKMVGERLKAKGIAIPGQEQQQQPGNQQQQKPPLSPEARARLKKLGVAANAPPNLRAMSGTNDDGSGIPTESSIETMREDDFDKLPEATQRRLMGTIP